MQLLHPFNNFDGGQTGYAPRLTLLRKLIVGCSQFHFMNAAVEETVRASSMGESSTVREEQDIYWVARMHGGKPEAHRSQYDFIDDFARHMRDGLLNASFFCFTNTPIEKSDANTRSVFGDLASQARHESVAPSHD